jgi:hypothetical protein
MENIKKLDTVSANLVDIKAPVSSPLFNRLFSELNERKQSTPKKLLFKDINSPLSKKALDLHESPSALYSPSKNANVKVLTQLASPYVRSLSFNSPIIKSDSPLSTPSKNLPNVALKFDSMKFSPSDNRDEKIFLSPPKESDDAVLLPGKNISRRERLLKRLNISDAAK